MILGYVVATKFTTGTILLNVIDVILSLLMIGVANRAVPCLDNKYKFGINSEFAEFGTAAISKYVLPLYSCFDNDIVVTPTSAEFIPS